MTGSRKGVHRLTTRFDPLDWDILYEQDRASGKGGIFQRGGVLVHHVFAEISKPGQYWLDVGCGTGRLTQMLAAKGSQIFALDYDEAMLHFARSRIKKGTSKTGSVTFVGASADRLPFGREKLDGVAAVSLLGCLADPQYFFSEINRILRPDGYALLTFTNRHSVILRVNNMLNRLMALNSGNRKLLEHYHLYSPEEAVRLFVDAGLEVLRILSYNFFLVLSDRVIPRFPNVWKVRSSHGRSVGSYLARNFLLIGKKP